MLQNGRWLVRNYYNSKLFHQICQTKLTKSITNSCKSNFSIYGIRLLSSSSNNSKAGNSSPNVQHEFVDKEENHNDNNVNNEDDIKSDIMSIALEKYVNERGWNIESLTAAANELNIPQHASQALFPRGGIDLVEYFYHQSNMNMVKHVKQFMENNDINCDSNNSDVTFRILQSGVEYRLKCIAPYLHSWPEAMVILANPSHSFTVSLPLLRELIDELWLLAGDVSTDMTWYSKRAALTGIYKLTELHLLQDKSMDQTATMQMLERLLHDFVKSRSAIQQMAAILPNPGNTNFEEANKILSQGMILGSNLIGLRK